MIQAIALTYERGNRSRPSFDALIREALGLALRLRVERLAAEREEAALRATSIETTGQTLSDLLAVEVTGPTSLPWTDDKPFRVHYYNAKKRGTWHRYFAQLGPAKDFARERRVFSRPCVVEASNRTALESL